MDFVGLVWRQGPWKGVVLWFGVSGTGPTPALTASAGDETAKDFVGSLGAQEMGSPHGIRESFRLEKLSKS